MNALSNLAALIAAYWPALVQGFWLTVQLLVVSALGGFLLALPVSIALGARSRRWRYPAVVYSLAMRGSPLFVQIFLTYYGLPQILISLYGGIPATRASIWWPLVSAPFLLISIAFVLNLTAYMAEDLRSGLDGVSEGERQAAIACGMTDAVMMRRILMPFALRTMMPALFNEVIITLKSTTLASTITLRDLLGAGSMIFSRTYDVSIYLLLAVFYLVMAGGLSLFFRLIERRYLIAHLLLAFELVADRDTMAPLEPKLNAHLRLVDLAYDLGLIIYSRRTHGGRIGDHFLVCPPLIVTDDQIDEIIDKLTACLERFATETNLPFGAQA